MPPAAPWRAALAVVLLVCLALAAAVLAAPRKVTGGGPRPAGPMGAPRARAEPPHLVVDTLNLAHWLRGGGPGEATGRAPPTRLTPALIAETIDATAPALLRRYRGRVMYVLKDRDSQFNSEAERSVYRQAAVRNRVYVCAAERYVDPPTGVAPSREHSAQGRDDFYMALLAWKWRCPVATEDRLRDFARLRATIQPFHVYEWAYWREAPARDFVRPESAAYARVRRPRTVRFEELGLRQN